MNAEGEEQDAAAALLGLIPHSDQSSHYDTADRHEGPTKKRKARSSQPEQNDVQQQQAADRELEDSKPKTVKKKRKKRKTHGNVELNYPVPPRVIQICKVPKTHVNHSYNDMTSVPPDDGYEVPTDLGSMTFSEKLHHLLSNKKYNDCIAWVHHGRAFRILVPKFLEERKILQKYFGHNRYSYFLTQLQHYGMKQFTQGNDTHAYYHDCLLRGMPHLCKYMPDYREGRKLIADPDHEPDLAAISALWPVPTESTTQTVTINGDSNRPSSANSEKLSGTSDSGGIAPAPGRRESGNEQGDDSGKKTAPRTAKRCIQSVSASSSHPQQPLQQVSAAGIAFPLSPSQGVQTTNDAMSSLLNQLVQQAGQQSLGQQPLPLPTSQISAMFSPFQQYQPPAASVNSLSSLFQVQGREQQQSQIQSNASLLNLLQQQPSPQLQAPQQTAESLAQQITSMVANAPTEQQQQKLIALITVLLNQNQRKINRAADGRNMN